VYSIHNYGEMILDVPRMGAYVRALRAAISPGCVVADIGAGTGIFAMLACQLGARRVFAVDPNPAIDVARQIAAANGFADRIEFFEALSTRIELPERADVIVSYLRGILPPCSQHSAATADARRRHLGPGGTMIPARDDLWTAVVEDAAAHKRVTAPWLENAYGLDMRVAAGILANDISRINARAEQMITDPAHLATLDYSAIESPHFAADVRLVAKREGTGHGLCAWFDSNVGPGITMSNAPGEPRLIYGEQYFPWPVPVALPPGDVVAVKIRADLVGDEYVWSWESRVSSATGEARAQFSQSNFMGEVSSPAMLRKRGASHVPSLSEDGEIERAVLEQMSGEHSLGEIARVVAARFPWRFPRWEEALAVVGEVSSRLGK